RSKNADPKWILPMICRLGHVTKKDIGQIRIFDRETKFEISKEAESRFREAVKAAGPNMEIPVEASEPPGAAPPRRPGPPRGRPEGGDARPPRRDFGPRSEGGDARPDRGPPRDRPRGDGPPPRGPRTGPPGAGFAGPKGPKKPWDPTAPKGPKGPGKPRKPRD
ncbi:MAG: DbpA RNA binding domain-containing protein, partial [Phenylobacterium sp.]|nr:DbpA RNA binding domain-containing protein [Phenylobacterium sp.]